MAAMRALAAEGITLDRVAYVAGHSLGEYSALHASNIISKEDTIRLVFKRGELMHREATLIAGAPSLLASSGEPQAAARRGTVIVLPAMVWFVGYIRRRTRKGYREV